LDSCQHRCNVNGAILLVIVDEYSKGIRIRRMKNRKNTYSHTTTHSREKKKTAVLSIPGRVFHARRRGRKEAWCRVSSSWINQREKRREDTRMLTEIMKRMRQRGYQ